MKIKIEGRNGDGYWFLTRLLQQPGVTRLEWVRGVRQREVGADYTYTATVQCTKKVARRLGVAAVVMDNIHRGMMTPLWGGNYRLFAGAADSTGQNLSGDASTPQVQSSVTAAFGRNGGVEVLYFCPDWWE